MHCSDGVVSKQFYPVLLSSMNAYTSSGTNDSNSPDKIKEIAAAAW